MYICISYYIFEKGFVALLFQRMRLLQKNIIIITHTNVLHLYIHDNKYLRISNLDLNATSSLLPAAITTKNPT